MNQAKIGVVCGIDDGAPANICLPDCPSLPTARFGADFNILRRRLGASQQLEPFTKGFSRTLDASRVFAQANRSRQLDLAGLGAQAENTDEFFRILDMFEGSTRNKPMGS